MTSRSANSGSCSLCGHRASKTKLAAHLATCVTSHGADGAAQALTTFRIDAANDPKYWVFVEARSDAAIRGLDAFLRDLWLECCGHLSAFFIGRREVPMGAPTGKAFGPVGARFSYKYDFGSTTALVGQVVGSRHGSIGRAPVRLLARNDPPALSCPRCAEIATNVCPYCLDDEEYLFCDTHAAEHEHAREEVYLPVVNSPRMGVCGYTG